MKRTYSIYTKFLEFNVEVQTATVETHSVISADDEMARELKDTLMKAVDHMKEDLLSFEWKYQKELAKVGH
jgi:hypothetical protein